MTECFTSKRMKFLQENIKEGIRRKHIAIEIP